MKNFECLYLVFSTYEPNVARCSGDNELKAALTATTNSLFAFETTKPDSGSATCEVNVFFRLS